MADSYEKYLKAESFVPEVKDQELKRKFDAFAKAVEQLAKDMDVPHKTHRKEATGPSTGGYH